MAGVDPSLSQFDASPAEIGTQHDVAAPIASNTGDILQNFKRCHQGPDDSGIYS
jgi:hypothetical protein